MCVNVDVYKNNIKAEIEAWFDTHWKKSTDS